MSRKKRKRNPRNIPINAADKARAKEQLSGIVVDRERTLLFTALRDKEGFGVKRLKRVWDKSEQLCVETLQNPLTVEPIMRRLECDVDGLSFAGWWNARSRQPREVKTQADLKREIRYNEAAAQAFAWAVFLEALHLAEGYGAVRLRRVVRNAGYLKESLDEGLITVRDLAQVLRDEAGIDLR